MSFDGAGLEGAVGIGELYEQVIDGTSRFCSTAVNCPHCPGKQVFARVWYAVCVARLSCR